MFSPFRERFSLSCSSPSSSPSSPSSKHKRNSIPSGVLATPSSKVIVAVAVGLGTIRDDVSILNDANMAVGGGAVGNTTTSAAAGHGNTSNMTTSGANVMLMKTLKRLPIINERQRWRRTAAAAADLRLLLQLRCGTQIAAGGGGAAAAAAAPPLGIHNP
ncbi:unnamed protein product [Anisakis simplex]|uniref:Uncharacterized protein n=1 Tax=Anisakis simplex TaxID=6269 RepID=A0A0M3K110_ANISI|nr:unnamed protein product [Anisakis simplex]